MLGGCGIVGEAVGKEEGVWRMSKRMGRKSGVVDVMDGSDRGGCSVVVCGRGIGVERVAGQVWRGCEDLVAGNGGLGRDLQYQLSSIPESYISI